MELNAGWSYRLAQPHALRHRGMRQRFGLSYTLPGSEVEFWTASYDFLQFIPIWRDFKLMVNLEAAYGKALGDTTSLPPYRQYFAGGPESVRGFRESRLGPKDSFGRPYGGNMKTVAQTELLLPMPEKWRNSARFSLFFDIGNVFSDQDIPFLGPLVSPSCRSSRLTTSSAMMSCASRRVWLFNGWRRWGYFDSATPFPSMTSVAIRRLATATSSKDSSSRSARRSDTRLPQLLLTRRGLISHGTFEYFRPGSVGRPGAARALGAAQRRLKIAVVNVPKLLEEAPQAKAAMQALQDEFAPRQRAIVSQQKDLKTKEEKLQRDGAVMAENERRNAEKDLREGQRELARKQNEYVEDLNLRRNEELGKMQRSLLQEVQTFARAANYDIVVGDGVLYVNDSMDITAQVLSALQSRYKSSGAPAATPKPATPPAKP